MKNTKTMTLTALFTAVTAVCSIISIPLPSGMPFTLQTFAVALAGYVLGWKNAAVSVGVYLVLGAVGIPVFSGFTGGFAHLFGLTGGFLWGFLLLAALCGAVSLRRKLLCAASGIAGLSLCHLAGAVQFSLVSGTSFPSAVLTASAPYIIKDILSVFGAYITACALRKALRAQGKHR